MQIGERLKRIREFRNITQKELGMALGYPPNSAAVRIAQYESCSVSPKKETATAISEILKCNYINLYSGTDLGKAELFMLDLFWMEELVGSSLYIFQLEKYNDKNDKRIVHGKVNDYNYNGVFPPVALAFDYNLANDFMREWAIRFNELSKKEITHDEYFEWKLNWPYTCDDGGRFEPSYQWRKVKNSIVKSK